MSGDYWIDVPAEENVFIINIGDMLDKLTLGRYRSTPHRVLNISGK
jgi:isopenicillin N synthase-like dioxygenase